MRGYEYSGVNPQTGDPTFVDHGKNDNGQNIVLSDADKVMIGSGIPDFTYGLTINMSYKGFDFTAFANGAAGNEIAYAVPRSTRIQANTMQYIFDNRWQKPGDNSLFPSAKLSSWKRDVGVDFGAEAYLVEGVLDGSLCIGFAAPNLEAARLVGCRNIAVARAEGSEAKRRDVGEVDDLTSQYALEFN